MALSKIPDHFLNSIKIDAILLTKLRDNKWDKVHEELMYERPILNLQTQYDYEHCFDFNIEFCFAERLPKLVSSPLVEDNNLSYDDFDLQDMLFNILTL